MNDSKAPDHTADDKAPPVEPVVKPDPPMTPVQAALHEVVTLVETLAAHVPTAHTLRVSVREVRARIDALVAKRK